MSIAVALFGQFAMVVGVLLYVIGWFGLGLEALRKRIVWGLLSLIIPPVALVFASYHL